MTLPDWQGLGLIMILAKNLGAAFKAENCRFRTYPAHPSLIRSFAHQKADWSMEKRGGDFSPARSCSSQVGGFGGRPCATFEYVGQQMYEAEALCVGECGMTFTREQIEADMWRLTASRRVKRTLLADDRLNLRYTVSEMKTLPQSEAERFDNAVRKVFSVSKEDMEHREAEWQRLHRKKTHPAKQ